MRHPRTLAIAALVAGGAGLLAQAAGAVSPAAPLSVLTQPQAPEDRLPAWVEGDFVVRQYGIDPAGTRLALRSRGRSFFVALGIPPGVYWGQPGRLRPPVACLIDVPDREPPLPDYRSGFAGGPSEDTGGINCQDVRVFRGSFVSALLAPGARRGFDAVGLAPQGLTSVRQGPRRGIVRNNVFLVRGARGPAPVVLTGRGGRRAQPLGLFRPPAPPHGPRVEFGLFSRARQAGDALPPRLRRRVLSIVRRPAGSGSERPILGASRSGRADGLRFWIIPDTDLDVVHLVTRGRGTAGSAGSFGLGGEWPRASRPFSFEYGCRPGRDPYGPRLCGVTGVIGDGYTRISAGARSAPIRDNVYVLRNVAVFGEVTVTFRGPAGTQTARLQAGGEQFRQQLPTNHVPTGVATLARARAAAAGDAGPAGARVVETTLGAVRSVFGSLPELRGRDRVVSVVIVEGEFASGARALTVVIAAQGLRRPKALLALSSATAPDLAALGRLRPLPLRGS